MVNETNLVRKYLTRRMAVADLGKAGLAVMVLGVVACSGDGGEPDSTGTTSRPATTSTSDVTVPADTTAPVSGTDFARVSLGFVSAYILYRAGEAVLVDTGPGGSLGTIQAALTELGLTWQQVGQVVLTHKHPDHQGSLSEVVAATSGVDIYAGAADIPAIEGGFSVLPVSDGDRVFDLDIIATPGHTPGHISVLDRVSGILVAGDAMNGDRGGVVGANPDFTEDMNLANASITKLAGFDYEVALFGHGDPLLEDASSAVADLAATLS